MKTWFTSKTLIVNALTLAASLLTVAAGSDLVAQYPRAAATLAALISGVNIALRFVTIMPIGTKTVTLPTVNPSKVNASLPPTATPPPSIDRRY